MEKRDKHGTPFEVHSKGYIGEEMEDDTMFAIDHCEDRRWFTRFIFFGKALLAFSLAALLATLVVFGTSRNAQSAHWEDTRTMNDNINQTNFIVGSGCSGTLISLEHRLILTNHHCITSYVRYVNREKVVKGVVEEVRLEELRDVVVSQKSYADYRQVGSATWQSQIVAKWKEGDLALLMIRAEEIPHNIQSNVFGGDKVYRGETVYVVGNPRGLDATVTKGIISSTNRTLRVSWADNQEVPFIQVSAGMAPGSSGGSLYNQHGEYIGVPAAGVGNIGLAVPFFRVQEFLTDNCYEDVWNRVEGVETHEECVERKEAEAEKEEDK